MSSTEAPPPRDRSMFIVLAGTLLVFAGSLAGATLAGEARFEVRGDTLYLLGVAHRAAMDGGDYRILPAMVEIRGDSIRWERENRGGGHLVVNGRFVSPDRIVGEESVVRARPFPPSFNPPKVTVVLERRK